MKVWKTRDVVDALRRKGFRPDTQGNRDHNYFRLWVNEKKTDILTHVSRSHDEIDQRGKPYKGMKGQLHLSASEIANLFDCPLTLEKYLAILDQKKIPI